LREVSLKIDPQYILSIHSFTPNYQGEARSMEIGVLCGHESAKWAAQINDGMNTKGYYSEINKPYDGITTMGAIKSLIFAKNDTKRQGITFEFRNDLLSNKKRCKKLLVDTADIVRQICQNN